MGGIHFYCDSSVKPLILLTSTTVVQEIFSCNSLIKSGSTFISPPSDLGKVFRALSTQTKCEIPPSTLAHLRSTYGVDE